MVLVLVPVLELLLWLLPPLWLPWLPWPVKEDLEPCCFFVLSLSLSPLVLKPMWDREEDNVKVLGLSLSTSFPFSVSFSFAFSFSFTEARRCSSPELLPELPGRPETEPRLSVSSPEEELDAERAVLQLSGLGLGDCVSVAFETGVEDVAPCVHSSAASFAARCSENDFVPADAGAVAAVVVVGFPVTGSCDAVVLFVEVWLASSGEFGVEDWDSGLATADSSPADPSVSELADLTDSVSSSSLHSAPAFSSMSSSSESATTSSSLSGS